MEIDIVLVSYDDDDGKNNTSGVVLRIPEAEIIHQALSFQVQGQLVGN
jgi:hypothetical protein